MLAVAHAYFRPCSFLNHPNRKPQFQKINRHTTYDCRHLHNFSKEQKFSEIRTAGNNLVRADIAIGYRLLQPAFKWISKCFQHIPTPPCPSTSSFEIIQCHIEVSHKYFTVLEIIGVCLPNSNLLSIFQIR